MLAGLAAVAFQWSITGAERLRIIVLETLHAAPHAALWGWAVLPAAGLVIGAGVGLAVKKWAPEAPGSGIPHVKGVLVNLRTMRWRGLIPVKFLGGALGIGAGLSMGREGPTVQMGAAVGRMVADVLRLPPRAVPQLISSGAGAGLAAAFNAPLAGFLFVLEELHREMSALTFGGALIAAVVADIVTRSLTGQLPSFSVKVINTLPLSTLPAVALLGVLGGLLGVLFNQAILRTQARARNIRIVPRWLLPGIAAAICGLVAWWLPYAAGGGHVVAEKLLGVGASRDYTVGFLLLLLVAKFALTVLSYASGAPGGIFAPMLLLGALTGMVFGDGMQWLFPTLGPHTRAFAMLGMAALFTGSVRAPLTGMVLILEMTGSYQQLLAVSVACLCAYLVAEATGDRPIYEALLEDDLKRGGGADEHESDAPRSVVVGIQHESGAAGKTLKEAGLPPGCLVVAVERGGRELMPTANLRLIPGDHITVLVPADQPEKALAVVARCTQHF